MGLKRQCHYKLILFDEVMYEWFIQIQSKVSVQVIPLGSQVHWNMGVDWYCSELAFSVLLVLQTCHIKLLTTYSALPFKNGSCQISNNVLTSYV